MRNENEIREEIEGLRSLTTAQLKEKYREVFGEQSRSNHKQFLFRRITWRIQANAWGGLSERGRQRALEIADDADLRIRAPKNFLRQPPDDGRTVEASRVLTVQFVGSKATGCVEGDDAGPGHGSRLAAMPRPIWASHRLMASRDQTP
jgi:hypothetical protein